MPEKFQRDIDRLISDGTRLNALTEQGVNYSEFGNQLATVSADFTIADAEWPQQHKPLARVQFQTAIDQWKLIYTIWHSQIEHDASFVHLKDELTDPNLIAAAAEYLPDLAKKNPPVSYRKVERALMTTAAKDFSSAVTEMSSTAK
ncbi:MAG: hypothetical protein WAO00_15060 [Chthoniobacterales bacterium]